MSWIIRRTLLIDCMSGGNRIRRSSRRGTRAVCCSRFGGAQAGRSSQGRASNSR
jgi:hypothetical protein